jgi:hypothetical protein
MGANRAGCGKELVEVLVDAARRGVSDSALMGRDGPVLPLRYRGIVANEKRPTRMVLTCDSK